jgi:exopolysaccharide production protein ExoZ
MMAGAGGRLANIQVLRAVAVLLVIAVHAQVNEARATGDPILPGWFYHGVSGVDLFFVISGFIMVWITRGRHSSLRRVGAFLFARVARIYPPVWLFTSLAIIGFVLQGTVDRWMTEYNVLYSYLLFPDELPPVLGVSWTLVHELYFYAVFAALLFAPAPFLPFGLGLWGAVVLAGQSMHWDTISPWTWLALHPLTFEFLIGAFAGLILTRYRPVLPLLFIVLGAVAFIGGVIWLGDVEPAGYPTGWGRVIAFAPGAALLVYGAAGVEIGAGLRAPRWIAAIGDWSYSLYLSHLLVIAALAHLWMRFAQPGVADNLLMVGLMFGIPIAVAAAAYHGFEQPIVRLAHSARARLFGTKPVSPQLSPV